MKMSSPTCTRLNQPDELPYTLEKLERFPGKYTLRLQQDAKPVLQPAGWISLWYMKRFEQQFNSLVRDGILVKVTEATDWVSTSLLVTKPGTESICICIDPAALNKAIKRKHYQI